MSPRVEPSATGRHKRAAWAALVLFLDLNDVTWDPDPPNVDEAEVAMLEVAAREVDEAWFADWLRERVRTSDDAGRE